MDKASVYGTGDCRFESYQGHFSAPIGGLGNQPARVLDLLNVIRYSLVG